MNPFGSILAFAAGLLVLWLICKLLAFPLKVLWKLVVNALLGAMILFCLLYTSPSPRDRG